MTGQITLFGRGAGSTPTASAVISDIIQITQRKSSSGQSRNVNKTTGYADLIKPKDLTHRYYMRLSTEDNPGILARIAGVLAKYNISIASVMQKAENTKYVPVIIMTHNCSAEGMQKSVKEINSFDFMEKDITLIKVED
jgi:homoserine dehydrogenase